MKYIGLTAMEAASIFVRGVVSCVHFQNAIASHESNGIDIIIALILNDINPLGKYRMDLVLALKASTPHQLQVGCITFVSADNFLLALLSVHLKV